MSIEAGPFQLRLSGARSGWEITATYDLRTHYGFDAARGPERIVVEGLPSIGKLTDRLEGYARLSESEVEQLHAAYLDRIPKRDVRQRIDLTLGSYHWLSLTIDFGPMALIKNNNFLKVLNYNLRYGLVIDEASALWVDDIDFRAYVIVFHEMVHRQQDLTTGLGSWDWTHAASEKMLDLEQASSLRKADANSDFQRLMMYGGRTHKAEAHEAFVRSSLDKSLDHLLVSSTSGYR